jgi:hypothetical protein
MHRPAAASKAKLDQNVFEVATGKVATGVLRKNGSAIAVLQAVSDNALVLD